MDHPFNLPDDFDFAQLGRDYETGQYTIDELCEEWGISRDTFLAIRKAAPQTWTKRGPNYWWDELDKETGELADEAADRAKAAKAKKKAQQKKSREQRKAAENWWALEEAIDGAIETESADYEPPKLQLTISEEVERDPACLVANASDYHLGNRPVHDGMGPEAYAEALLEANKSVAKRALRSADVDKVFLVIGSDLLNVDNAQEQTTRGTDQKNQMSTSDLLHHAEMFGRDLVNVYRQVADVEMVHVAGNHDATLSQAIYQMLDAHFAGESDVTAGRDFAQRQYRTWRDMFLCLTHGQYSRKIFKRLPQICINEARSEIAGTSYSTIHTGHLHSEKVRFDESGWVHQQAPAPVQLDDWHEGKGYVGSRQAVQGTLHFEGGADHVINETLGA